VHFPKTAQEGKNHKTNWAKKDETAKDNKLRKDVRNEERKQVKRRKDDTRDQTKTRKGTRKPTNKNQRTDSKNKRRHLMPGINSVAEVLLTERMICDPIVCVIDLSMCAADYVCVLLSKCV